MSLHVVSQPFSFRRALSFCVTSSIDSGDGSTGHHFVACWVAPPRACQRCLVSKTLTEATSCNCLIFTDMRARSRLPKPSRPNIPYVRSLPSISIHEVSIVPLSLLWELMEYAFIVSTVVSHTVSYAHTKYWSRLPLTEAQP